MAEISKFWTGISPGDAGPYSADQFADYARNAWLAGKGDFGPLQGSGTSPDIGLTVQQLAVPGAAIQVTPGAALVDGYFYELTATQQVNIAANASGNPRIDTIILRADWTLQTVRLQILQGTPAGTPAPPSLTQNAGVRWEIPLADVAVANGFVSITNANITYRRNWGNVGGNLILWDVLNNSGGTLVEGDLVIWDTSADRAVTTSTTLGDSKLAGVWLARTSAGSYGRMIVRGIARVNTNAAVTRGNTLTQSTTAKQAAILAAGTTGQKAIAYALNTTGGAGLAECYIDAVPQYHYQNAAGHVSRTGVADYTSTSGAFADVDAANLIITLVTSKPTIMFEAAGAWTSGAAVACLVDMILDSTTRFGGADGSARSATPATVDSWWSIVGRFTGLAPGSHTLKLQFAGLGTVANGVTIRNNAFPVTMRAWEL